MTSTEINGKKPKFFNSAIAENGDKNTIKATGTDEQVSQSLGFGNKFSTPRDQQGKSVSRRDMNGLFHDVSSLNYYFQYMGRNPWKEPTGDDDAYPQGAKVWYNNAEYVSTVDKNREVPGADGVTTWIKLNDLSGTSGGGSSVSCSWSSIPPSSINGIVSGSAMIPGISSTVQDLTGKILSLSGQVSDISTKMDNISVKPVFLNPDSHDDLSVTSIATSAVYSLSASHDGRFILSIDKLVENESSGDPMRLDISLKNSQNSTQSKIGSLLLNGSKSTATFICNKSSYEVDVKQGQFVLVQLLPYAFGGRLTTVTLGSHSIYHYL